MNVLKIKSIYKIINRISNRMELIYKDYHNLRDKSIKSQVAYDKQAKAFANFLKKVDERKVSDERYKFLAAEQLYQNDFSTAERVMAGRQDELRDCARVYILIFRK